MSGARMTIAGLADHVAPMLPLTLAEIEDIAAEWFGLSPTHYGAQIEDIARRVDAYNDGVTS